MFDNNDKSQYEGLFARKPQATEHDWMNGGSIERHTSCFDGNTAVIKDAWGNVIRVEKQW